MRVSPSEQVNPARLSENDHVVSNWWHKQESCGVGTKLGASIPLVLTTGCLPQRDPRIRVALVASSRIGDLV